MSHPPASMVPITHSAFCTDTDDPNSLSHIFPTLATSLKSTEITDVPMTLLYRHLRIHQVFGANTDVGKTIFATALVRTSAHRGHNVLYLKPVSTGGIEDADDLYGSSSILFTPQSKILITSLGRHVRRFSGSPSGRVEVDCSFRLREPVSPHLAVLRQEGSDQVFISPPTLAGDTHTHSAGYRWRFSQCDNKPRIIIRQGCIRRRPCLH